MQTIANFTTISFFFVAQSQGGFGDWTSAGIAPLASTSNLGGCCCAVSSEGKRSCEQYHRAIIGLASCSCTMNRFRDIGFCALPWRSFKLLSCTVYCVGLSQASSSLEFTLGAISILRSHPFNVRSSRLLLCSYLSKQAHRIVGLLL